MVSTPASATSRSRSAHVLPHEATVAGAGAVRSVCAGAAGRPQDVQAHRDRVEEPCERLADRRHGLEPEHPRQERRADGPGRDQPAQVERLRLQDVDPAGLMRRVDRAREQPGGHEHQHEAREPEEAGQVDPDAALVDREPQADRHGDPECRARPGGRRVLGVAEDRQQEDRGLEPFAQDREERHTHEGPRRPQDQGVLGTRLERPFSSREWRFIHTTMYVTPADREQREDRLEPFLLLVGERLVDRLEDHGDGQAQPDREGDAVPHGSEGLRSPRWIRNAAMMPTMSEASRPSRSPMMNVGSTWDPSVFRST